MMMFKKLLVLVIIFFSSIAWAGMEDDPLLGSVFVNEFESRNIGGDDTLEWDVDAWLGKDLNKLWVKAEGEYSDGETEDVELQFLYSRAVDIYWDFQAGLRTDLQPQREWLALGFLGLAPYFFEIDAAVFIGENGRSAARLDAEYELLFTQRLILTPEIEINLYGKDDPRAGVGSGLSDIEAGLRLRYEFRREFAPYIGVNWTKKFGDTADILKARGEVTHDLQFVMGIRAWF